MRKEKIYMEQLKTLCADSLGTGISEELKPFVEKYHEKLDVLIKEYVEECLEENIDYCSAYGFILSRTMCLLSLHYCKSGLMDKTKNNAK